MKTSLFMNGRIKNLLRILATAFLSITCLAYLALAQTDPDPNSPTPVLLNAADQTRAPPVRPAANSPDTSEERFNANSRAVLYVTNGRLMKGEVQTAFRVYA